jgi:hypothetical protein
MVKTMLKRLVAGALIAPAPIWALSPVTEALGGASSPPAAAAYPDLSNAQLPALNNLIAKSGAYFNVKAGCNGNPGAVGDGVTDDTAAIQACLDAAANVTPAADYISLKQQVYFPSGQYLHHGLTVQPTVALLGDGYNATSLFLKNGSNVSSIIIPGYSAGLHYTGVNTLISGLTIDGNRSNQSGTSHGIELQDDTSGNYAGSVTLNGAQVVNNLSQGINGGANRNGAFVNNSRIWYNGGVGVVNRGYDWFFSAGSVVSENAGGGYWQVARGCTWFNNTSLWSNGTFGIRLGSGSGCYLFFQNGAIQDNGQEGILNESVAYVSLTNADMDGNSASADNTYSMVKLTNAGPFSASNNVWRASLTNKPKYLIEQSGTTSTVDFDYTNVIQTSPNPYQTAKFSSPSTVTALQLGSSLTTTGAGALTLAGPGSAATYTLPSATDTLAGLGTAQTWTGAQTFSTLRVAGSTSGSTLLRASSTASGTISFPNVNGTAAVIDVGQTYTAEMTYNTDIKFLPISAPSAPASGWVLYVDSGDGNKFKAKASTGTVVTLGTP